MYERHWFRALNAPASWFSDYLMQRRLRHLTRPCATLSTLRCACASDFGNGGASLLAAGKTGKRRSELPPKATPEAARASVAMSNPIVMRVLIRIPSFG